MALPFDYYIRFLASKGFDDVNDVNDHLKELNLSPITQACFEKQTDLIYRTLPKAVLRQLESKIYEGDYLKWMRVLEVQEFWAGEKPFIIPEQKRILNVVLSINDDPHLRLCMNGLLMKGVRGKDLCESVNPKFSAMFKEEHTKLYQKYFFDPQRMTRSDWKVYLKSCDNKEKHIYFTALSENIEILKTELELPTSVDTTAPLQFLLTKSYMKAKQYLELSTKEANAEARAWISQVMALTEKYVKYKASDTADFAKTLQMEFDFVDNEFATPDSDVLKELQLELMAKENKEKTLESSPI